MKAEPFTGSLQRPTCGHAAVFGPHSCFRIHDARHRAGRRFPSESVSTHVRYVPNVRRDVLTGLTAVDGNRDHTHPARC